jgi:hypothetical protein
MKSFEIKEVLFGFQPSCGSHGNASQKKLQNAKKKLEIFSLIQKEKDPST